MKKTIQMKRLCARSRRRHILNSESAQLSAFLVVVCGYVKCNGMHIFIPPCILNSDNVYTISFSHTTVRDDIKSCEKMSILNSFKIAVPPPSYLKDTSYAF